VDERIKRYLVDVIHATRRPAEYNLDIGPYIPPYSIEIDIRKLQQMLRAVMPAAAITAREANGSIILTGRFGRRGATRR